MPWSLLFGGAVILGVFGLYSMAVEHAKDMQALKSRVTWAEARVKVLTVSVRKKNEYIKKLETNLVKDASPDALVGMLNSIFMHEDEDGLSDSADVPSVGGPDETRTDLGAVRTGQTLP